jgi:hypothetical protein
MSTAIRPTTAKNWSEYFSNENGYPEEGEVWGEINGILYNIALFERFGWKGNPHSYEVDKWHTESQCAHCEKPKREHPIRLTNVQTAFLAYLEGWLENSHLDVDTLKYGTEEYNKAETDFGRLVLNFIRIAKSKPQTGHFVGRGFDGNERDADKFLGNDDG